MNFGIALPTPADSWRTVKRAEDAGFSTAWFYDTQLLSADIFVAMGAAAVKTDRIRLGTGMLIPSNRIAPVAANGLATLNARSGPYRRRFRDRLHRSAEYGPRDRAVGRDPAGKRKSIFSFGSVLKEGEGYDSPRVKAEVGLVAMMMLMMLHNAMEQQNYGSLIGEFESSIPPNPALYQIVPGIPHRLRILCAGRCEILDAAQGPFDVCAAGGGLFRHRRSDTRDDRQRYRARIARPDARLREAGYAEVVVQIAPGCESMIGERLLCLHLSGRDG